MKTLIKVVSFLLLVGSVVVLLSFESKAKAIKTRTIETAHFLSQDENNLTVEERKQLSKVLINYSKCSEMMLYGFSTSMFMMGLLSLGIALKWKKE